MSDALIHGATEPNKFTFLKPSYNMTFSNADGVIGTLDFNGPEMVFTGKAEESAKVFFDHVAQCFAQRLAELEQDKKRLEWVMPVIAMDHGPDAYKRLFALAQGLADGLEGRACIDRAMK